MGEVRLNLDEWIHFTSTITQSGNSLVITIPKHVREAYGLREGFLVEVYLRPRKFTADTSDSEREGSRDLYTVLLNKILEVSRRITETKTEQVLKPIFEDLKQLVRSKTDIGPSKYVKSLLSVLNCPECVIVEVTMLEDNVSREACERILALLGAESFIMFYNIEEYTECRLKFLSYLRGGGFIVKRKLTVEGAKRLGAYPPIAYSISYALKNVAQTRKELGIDSTALAEAVEHLLSLEPYRIIGRQVFLLGFRKAVGEIDSVVLCEAEIEYDPEKRKYKVQKVTCQELQ